MKAKAYIKENPTKPIKLGEVEIRPKQTDLVIKTTYVGLSKGDVFIMENKWGSTVYPSIGTGETVGIVESMGEKTKGFKIGDRVAVGYIVASCMRCEYCSCGEHQYCRKQVNTELGGWGGLAEKVAVDYRLVVKIPENIDSVVAAPLVCYGVTAYSGIMKANLQKGNKVGIIGFGGLGQISVGIANALEMKVSVFSGSEDKKVLSEEFGAFEFYLTTANNWSKSVLEKLDLVINSSPADLDLASYLELLKPDGKFCYLGLPFNEQKFRAGQLADYGSRTIYGSYVGSISETNALLRLAAEKNIFVDVVTYNISDYEKAVDFIKQNTSHKRVVLKW